MLNNYFLNLWKKSLNFSSLSTLEKIIFVSFIPLEYIYKLLFFCVQNLRLLLKHSKKSNFKVISIGNISVGGTGKSVLTRFLVSELNCKYSGSIILRGYKSKLEKNNSNLLIDHNNILSLNSKIIGDEPYMLFKLLKVPIVVGPNRIKSIELLEDYSNKSNKIDYVILDDCYQNNQLFKNIEILILDARYPFGNGHCLPAGPLREKNIFRADCIILSHVDYLDHIQLKAINTCLEEAGFNKPVFMGKHKPSKIVDKSGAEYDFDFFNDKKVLPFAGIGSFEQFVMKLENIGMKVFNSMQFQDHHDYSKKDLDAIHNAFSLLELDGIITTYKDFYKILPFIESDKKWNKLYIVDVMFELSNKEEFFNFIDKHLNS